MSAPDTQAPRARVSAWLEWLAVAAIIVAGFSLYSARLKPHLVNSYDQVLYLSMAGQLLDGATLGRSPPSETTNGVRAARVGPERPFPMAIAPLYPAFIAALAAIDGPLNRTVRCVSMPPESNVNTCPNELGILVWAQLALAIGTSVILWRTAYAVTRSKPIALLALAAASFGSAEYAEYAHAAMTETLSFFFFAAFDLSFLVAVQRRTSRAALVSGLCLGAATLTRPAFLYLGLIVVVAAFGWMLWSAVVRRGRPACFPAGSLGAIFLGGFACLVAPWILRNYLVFGVADVTQGYGANTLIQRLAYDGMSAGEWLVGFIYFLPDFGHSWAKALFSPGAFRRLSYDAPDAFYVIGARDAAAAPLALQLPFLKTSESMGNHDSEIVDAFGVD
ncbi:MAG: hypothetical protein ACREFL_10020 [Stellaceae bacterium]